MMGRLMRVLSNLHRPIVLPLPFPQCLFSLYIAFLSFQVLVEETSHPASGSHFSLLPCCEWYTEPFAHRYIDGSAPSSAPPHSLSLLFLSHKHTHSEFRFSFVSMSVYKCRAFSFQFPLLHAHPVSFIAKT